jgi:hypothetical protein
VGGVDDGNDCANNADCDSTVCSNASNPDCPGGSCQLDPDTANAPYNNDDTVTCGLTVCPCEGLGRCYDGPNEDMACTTDAECGGGNVCSWVRCP